MAGWIESLVIGIGLDWKAFQEGMNNVQKSAQAADTKFNAMSRKWAGLIKGLISQVIAPIAGGFAVGKIVNSYMKDVSEVATLTGAYSQKLEEWRIKRAQLARVTKEDIELYKKSREAVVGFNIAMADLSAKITRSFTPVIKLALEGLNAVTKWLDRNGDNITRFLLTTAGVITAVFTPALIKMGVAMLASPLTWLVAALGAVVLVIDDLVTYIQGGETALSGFWALFGSGEEILYKLTAAFNFIKRALELTWPLFAAFAANIVIFKTGAVLVAGFSSALGAVQKAMMLLAANPIVLVLTAIVMAIMWVRDAFIQAGGDWSKTFEIMGQSVKNAVNIILGFLGYLFAPIQGIIDAVSNGFNAVIDGASAMVEGAVNAVSGFFGAVDSWAQGVSDSVSSFVGSVAEGASSMWQGVKDGASTALTTVSTAVSGAASFVAENFSTAVATTGQAFSGLADLGISVFAAIRDGADLSQVWDMITGGLRDILNLFGGLGDTLAGAFAKAGELAQSAWDAFASVFPNIADFLSAAFAAWLTIPKTIASVVMDTAHAVVEGVQTLWGGLTSGVSAVGDGISAALSWVSDGFTAVLTTVRSALDAVASFASQVASFVSSAVSAVVNGITAYYQFLWDILTTIVDAYISAVKTVIEFVQSAFTAVGNAISSAVSTAVNFVTSAVSAAGAAVTSIVSAVSSGFEALWRAAVEVVTGAFSALWDGVTGVYDAVSDAVRGIRNAISGAFAAAWDFALDLVRDAAQGISDALSAAWDFVVGVVGDAANAIGSTVSDVVEVVTGAFALIPEFASSAWDSVVDTIDAALDGAITAVSTFVDTVLSFFAQIPEFLAQVFDVSGLIEDAVSSITGAVGSAWNKAKSFFGFGEEEQAAGSSAAPAAALNAPANLGAAIVAPMAPALANMSQAYAQVPITASTQSIVTNNAYSNEDHRSDNRQRIQNNNTTININTTGDGRALGRQLRQYLPSNTQTRNNYVSATEQGVWNM